MRARPALSLFRIGMGHLQGYNAALRSYEMDPGLLRAR